MCGFPGRLRFGRPMPSTVRRAPPRIAPAAPVGALLGALIALGISIVLLFAGLEMPPAPGRSTGYPLQIAISPVLYTITMVAITLLSMLCSAAIASRTANKPIVEALGHV